MLLCMARTPRGQFECITTFVILVGLFLCAALVGLRMQHTARVLTVLLHVPVQLEIATDTDDAALHPFLQIGRAHV